MCLNNDTSEVCVPRHISKWETGNCSVRNLLSPIYDDAVFL